MDLPDAQDVHARLADDPWTPTDTLRTGSIDPWEVLLTAPETRISRRRE
jgi:hypothetical protein